MLLAFGLIALTLCDFFGPRWTWAEPPDLEARAGGVRAYHRPAPGGPPLGGPRLDFQLCRDRWQEMLRPDYTVRVWVAGTTQLVAELPMPLVVTVLTQFVAQAGLTAAYLGLAEAARKPPGALPARPVPGLPPPAVQAARRAARAARLGRAGRKPIGRV